MRESWRVSPPTIGRFSFDNRILRPINGLRYARQPSCIVRARSGKPIGQQPLARHKVALICAELQKGTGIIKTARLCGTGVSAVQRIKAAMR